MRGASGSHGEGRSHTHLCEVFDDPADFRAHAVEFLADGLGRGCRVRYVAPGDVDMLRAHVAPLLHRAHRPDAVEVLCLADPQPATACVDAADLRRNSGDQARSGRRGR